MTISRIISFSPLIEINSAGDAAVIWTALDNNFATLQGRIYYNGSWDSSPTLLSIGSESITGYYDLKLNNNGEIGVIWSSFSPNTGDYSIYVLTGSTVAAGWNTGTGITKISD